MLVYLATAFAWACLKNDYLDTQVKEKAELVRLQEFSVDQEVD